MNVAISTCSWEISKDKCCLFINPGINSSHSTLFGVCVCYIPQAQLTCKQMICPIYTIKAERGGVSVCSAGCPLSLFKHTSSLFSLFNFNHTFLFTCYSSLKHHNSSFINTIIVATTRITLNY